MLLGFLAFVVLLSGLVAYSADTIARKAGRKHLRWFGLRPKTTALLVAVASGMGISLLSVLAFGLLNRAAIRNILQADQLRMELAQLKKDVATTNAGLGKVQAQRDQADARARSAVQQTALAQQHLRQAAAQLQSTQQARAGLQKEVLRLQARTHQLAQLQAQLAAQAKQGQQALAQSRLALQNSTQREAAQRRRLSGLAEQLSQLDRRTAQAEQKAENAEQRARQLQGQTQALERSRATVLAQLGAAQRQLLTAQQQRHAAQQALNEASRERAAALQARDVALAQRVQLLQQWQQVRAQLAAAVQQREAVRAEVQGLKTSVSSLDAQRRSLLTANGNLQASLNSTRADLSRLEVDYTRTNSELSANRNLDLVYSRGDLVYAGTVASVRNLPAFLVTVTGAAQKAGARGNPAARLDNVQRQVLENKLRGLNTSTFVQCRAAVNVAVGFPVDLNCAARPQTLLYRRNQPIVQATIDLQRGTDALSSQVVDLSRNAVQALTSRGVPPETITDHGLSDTERLDLLGKLAAQSGSSVTVSLVARNDVRLGSPVDLVAVVAGR